MRLCVNITSEFKSTLPKIGIRYWLKYNQVIISLFRFGQKYWLTMDKTTWHCMVLKWPSFEVAVLSWLQVLRAKKHEKSIIPSNFVMKSTINCIKCSSKHFRHVTKPEALSRPSPDASLVKRNPAEVTTQSCLRIEETSWLWVSDLYACLATEIFSVWTLITR